ncbi:HNH endonuclease [Imhoffiella purpurea]|uniref:Uncharacterized protein n=1 Tax=Imhoffiella purpurea TaxID=1249627 RepID=W9W2Y8_9GAMM|nr:HNH endonuclease [Imhoffiella purpurea]EXJ16935.1 hypothetical protein D779_1758 [Imhoffiella purpurea]
MARGRLRYLELLADQLGSDLMRVLSERDGWPALCEFKVGDAWMPVGLHIGLIGKSGRGRDDVERRFQNPGDKRPMIALQGYIPALVGVRLGADERIDVMAGMHAAPRVGQATRQSLFLPLQGLDAAASGGWVDHVSASGEVIHLFRPELLPAHLALGDHNIGLPEAPAIVEASGWLDEQDTASIERARYASVRAARRQGFGREVALAYGERCAMCGLGSGLIEGAHIYPVEAPGSPDAVWNGIALCRNHHRAFDLHRIAVDVGSWRIAVHPELRSASGADAALSRFLEMTSPVLTLPADLAMQPKVEMLEQRYAFYGDQYEWLG